MNALLVVIFTAQEVVYIAVGYYNALGFYHPLRSKLLLNNCYHRYVMNAEKEMYQSPEAKTG